MMAKGLLMMANTVSPLYYRSPYLAPNWDRCWHVLKSQSVYKEAQLLHAVQLSISTVIAKIHLCDPGDRRVL